MRKVNYTLVGRKIKDKRLKMGITQEKLAEMCFISVSYVAHIERGTRNLSLDTAVRISTVLDISLDYLILDELHDNNRIMDSLETELEKCSLKQVDAFLRISRILIQNIEEL